MTQMGWSVHLISNFILHPDIATAVQLVPLEVVVISPLVCASVPLEQPDVHVIPAYLVILLIPLDIAKVSSWMELLKQPKNMLCIHAHVCIVQREVKYVTSQ